MSKFFLKPKSLREKVKLELDLSNNATKADLKSVAGVDTSKFFKKVDLASLKSEMHKLDIAKTRNYSSWFKRIQWCSR